MIACWHRLYDANPATNALIVAGGGALVILGAHGFQYGLGIQPCPLCLDQRMAYYATIPLALLLWLSLNYGAARKVIVAGFAVTAAIMLWNAGLGGYHAGVEWHWWPGPSDCSGPINEFGPAGGLLKQLRSISVVRCDEVSLRILGLSLAGWNMLISLALALVAVGGARTAMRQASR